MEKNEINKYADAQVESLGLKGAYLKYCFVLVSATFMLFLLLVSIGLHVIISISICGTIGYSIFYLFKKLSREYGNEGLEGVIKKNSTVVKIKADQAAIFDELVNSRNL